MSVEPLSIQRKALEINIDKSRYGTFAEIGAGQEVARHFFKAGLASQTIAKTMSAYDMTFSDAIYGREKSGRYVCESRLIKMLDHEYSLLLERLQGTRGDDSCFFAYANTVTTNKKPNRSHGWMGIRFQTRPGGPANEIILHVKILNRDRLLQQEAIGALGVNFIHSAFYRNEGTTDFVRSLVHHLSSERIEVDMVKFSGPDLEPMNNRLLGLELVRQGLTKAILFHPQNGVTQASEALYNQPVLIQRGTFRPVTKTNIEILEHGLMEYKKQEETSIEPTVLMEITMKNLKAQGQIDQQDFLDRVDTLLSLGHSVLISNFFLFYELKKFLRSCTSQAIYMLIGASHLEKLFEEKYYEKTDGGLLGAFGRLFDKKSHLLVFPYKTEDQCITASSFHPQASLQPLYNYLLQNQFIKDISGCEQIDTTLHSEMVRTLWEEQSPLWEELVPKPVAKLIKDKKLFGYHE